MTKARKGGFKDTSLEYIVYALLKEVKNRSGIDPALIEDICLGNVGNVPLEPGWMSGVAQSLYGRLAPGVLTSRLDWPAD